MTVHELLFLLLLAFCNSLIIIGWNKATDFELSKEGYDSIDYFVKNKLTCWEDSIEKGITDKMIFWKLRFWSLKYFGSFWSKPLFTCPTCMSSVHSTYFYWAIMPFTLHSLMVYPFYVIGLAGMVSIINNYA